MNVYIKGPLGQHAIDAITRHEIIDDVSFENSLLVYSDAISHSLFDTLIARHGVPAYIVSDGSFFKYKNYNVYCLNNCLTLEAKQLEKVSLPSTALTTHAVNFCINKKQLNRHLTLKLCEIFNLDCAYTWSGIGHDFDLNDIVKEKQTLSDPIIDKYFSDLLAPVVKFKKHWFESPGSIATETSITDYGSNDDTWQLYLRDIFSKSAVSLISESVITDNAMYFTEKTLYAMLGLTFPIWIGGKYQAKLWNDYGFDTFNDIIDHSYQNFDTVLERCFYAVYLNLELLTNKQRLAKLRSNNLERLLANQKLVHSETFRTHNNQIISHWPKDLQQAIKSYVN